MKNYLDCRKFLHLDDEDKEVNFSRGPNRPTQIGIDDKFDTRDMLRGYVVGNDDDDYNEIVNPDWNTCMIHIYDRSQLSEKGSSKRVTHSFRLTSGVVKSMRNGRGNGDCCWRIWR